MHSSKTVILFLLFLFSYTAGHGQFKNEDELKKQANKYFEDEDYSNGFKLYSQLVSNYPKDPNYNFRLGVCMLYTDPDKKKAISYLNVAAKTAKDNEKEALFYLGKAYHFNYRFDEAISYYVQYKNIASASMIKKLQVDREMQACKNGKRLLANVEELVVLDKKQVNESDYFRSYDLKSIGGKLLIKPDEFRTAADKKKKDKSIIYLPKSNDQLYYTGYGEKSDNKDIFSVKKLPNGAWSKPESIGAPVNTEFDEDYPFLHPNGTVLYFASKGHNSMGGYDLFKSELDPSTNKWKEPINLAFPVNSPNDDILFVTDSLEKVAFFSSDRQSPWGKTDVYKILTEKRPAEFAVISGTILKKDPGQSVLSKIKVKNIETGEDVGAFNANQDGAYSLKLPNGGKFIFTVETPGFTTQSEGVTIPMAYNYIPYKQAIGYENQKLYITNFFDVKGDDENNYKEYLDLIAQKSKMDVNATDFGINPDNPLASNNQVTGNNNQVKNTKNEAIADNNQVTNENKNKNLSNKELIQMAYDDANELQQAADSLKENAKTAFSAANSKEDQAKQKKQEAEQTQSKANTEPDATKKQELINEVNKQNDEATLLAAQSTTANNIAKQLEIDATNKQKEADLNLQYAKALEEAEKTKNNKQALAKLEDLQKQLEEASKQKSNSNALVEGIKADANNKQQELQSAQTKQEKLESDIKNITNEISNLDKQIGETKDNDLVENLKTQKQEQESDLSDKKKELGTTQSKINSLKEEAETLKSQADFAATIAGGNQETQNNTQLISNNNKETDNNRQVANNNNQSITNNNQVTENKQATENNNQSITNDNQVTDNNTSNQNNEIVNNNQRSNDTQQQIEDLNKQADDLSAQARQIRKDAKTLNGTDKQNAMNKISELEKQVTDLRYKAAKKQIDSDKNTYTNTQQNIQNLLKNPENKQNADRVQQLSEEADILNKAAQELKEESEADPSIDSRVGGLSNADEKQKAALAKQQEALKLLKTDGAQNITQTDVTQNTTQTDVSQNTTQTDEVQNTTKDNSTQADVTQNAAQNNVVQNTTQTDVTQNAPNNQQQNNTEVNTDVNKAEQNNTETNEADSLKDSKLSSEDLKSLTDKNKTEYNALLAELNKLEKENKTSPEIKALKTQAMKDIQEANANLGKASANKSEENKHTQLLVADLKTKDAIKKIKQAEQVITGVPVTNEVATKEIQNNISDKQIPGEANVTNTVTTNNETQDKQQNETNNSETVTSNTVEPSNNQTQNNNDNTVSSNTVIPSSNEATGNLSPQEVNEIKNTVEYKQYNTLQKETEKYNNQALKEQNQADLYKNRATENSKRAEQLKADAASLPDGTEKQDKLNQAEKLEQNGAVLKARADSLQEIASNSRSFAESKKQEADAYSETLDKKTYDNIVAISSNSMKETTSQTNESNNNSSSNEVNMNTVVTNQNNLGNKNSTVTNNTDNVNREQGNTEAQKYIGTKGFEIKQTNAYNKNRPIPINEKLPEGIVFRVQIGAFKNPIATDQFKGLAPIGGETTPQGFIRYQAGMFDKYNNANAVKNDLKKLGYKDAFVVAYLNGKRINLADALASLQQKGEPVNTDANTTAGITANNNVPVNNSQPANTVVETQAVQSGNINTVNGLLYTIQIGVYTNNVSNGLLKNLKPIYREKMDNGNYRYTAGIYSNLDLVKTDRRKVNAIGIGDAFVSAYLNGQKIKITDAIEKANNDKTIQFPPQQPIIFPNDATTPGSINNTNLQPENNTTQNNTTAVQPFSNGVTEDPAPTADNGVKANDEGITFKVQIGAFRNQVPQQIADTWLKVKTWPIKYMQVNDLYLYTVGSFTEARFAQKLREEVVGLGIKDAFIAVFKDGKKLGSTESQKYLTR